MHNIDCFSWLLLVREILTNPTTDDNGRGDDTIPILGHYFLTAVLALKLSYLGSALSEKKDEVNHSCRRYWNLKHLLHCI